jgi:AraC-like DNA-binding protein
VVQDEAGVFRFSTDDLPERERFSAWQDTFGRSVVKMDMKAIGSDPFRSEAHICVLPNLTIASITATPMRGTRSRALAADGSDDIVLGILISGQAKSRQGNREVSFEAGEAVLWPNDAPGEGLYHSPIEFLTLAIPRIVLTQALPDIDDALMRLVPKDNDAVRLLTGYVRLLQGEVGQMSPQLKAASSAHVRDLVALAIGATGDTAEIASGRGARIARLRAVKTDILANLTRRELSADMLAARHGISPRYLRTLFESEQTTFTDFVLEQRLARAHRCLGDKRFAGHMISTIAFEAGFGDLSYFNLAFRRRYRQTPSDIRAAQNGKDDPAV